MNFLPEKKYWVPSHNFLKKNVLCEKGDEITRFDGSYHISLYSNETYTGTCNVDYRHLFCFKCQQGQQDVHIVLCT